MRNDYDVNELDDIKSRLPLSSLFEQLGFKVRGGTALCPFHNERTPSCDVSDKKAVYYCFGCGAMGDHFNLLMDMEGITLPQAIERLGGARVLTPEQRGVIEDRRASLVVEAENERKRQRNVIEDIWSKTKPIMDTHASAYLDPGGENFYSGRCRSRARYGDVSTANSDRFHYGRPDARPVGTGSAQLKERWFWLDKDGDHILVECDRDGMKIWFRLSAAEAFDLGAHLVLASRKVEVGR